MPLDVTHASLLFLAYVLARRSRLSDPLAFSVPSPPPPFFPFLPDIFPSFKCSLAFNLHFPFSSAPLSSPLFCSPGSSPITSLYAPPPLHAPFLSHVRTIDNNLHAGSLGCAPTPSQYFALTLSRRISLNGLPSPSSGVFGIGSYVPRTSIGLLLRAVLLLLSDHVLGPHPISIIIFENILGATNLGFLGFDGKWKLALSFTYLAWQTTML